MIDFELIVDEMRIEARAAILDGCTLELEPSQFSDCMEYLIEHMRQAEKDAARYRWLCALKIYDQFDSIDQVFYDNKVDTDEAIDEAMQCRK